MYQTNIYLTITKSNGNSYSHNYSLYSIVVDSTVVDSTVTAFKIASTIVKEEMIFVNVLVSIYLLY